MTDDKSHAITEKQRGHKWQPGQSGNPKGRPGGYEEFRALCRTKSPAAVLALELALGAGDTSSVAAARVLLEYGWGKPSAAPEDLEAVREANPLSGLTLEQLRELASRAEEE